QLERVLPVADARAQLLEVQEAPAHLELPARAALYASELGPGLLVDRIEREDAQPGVEGLAREVVPLGEEREVAQRAHVVRIEGRELLQEGAQSALDRLDLLDVAARDLGRLALDPVDDLRAVL